MLEVCNHQGPCPYAHISEPLPSGATLPDKPLCPLAGYLSVESWSNQFVVSAPRQGVFYQTFDGSDNLPFIEQVNTILDDPRREERWQVPLDEFRYVWLGSGSPQSSIRYPPEVARRFDHKAHGGVYVVIRQWVEETKPPTTLVKALSGKYSEAWRFCLEQARFIIANPHESNGRARTVTEDIRQQALCFSGLPATPSTARYLLSLIAPDHPEVATANDLIPRRGLLLTSIGIGPSRRFPEIGATMTHKMDLHGPWITKDILISANQTAERHAGWFSRQAEDFSLVNLSSENGRTPKDLDLHHDVEACYAGQLTEDDVIQNHVKRSQQDLTDSELPRFYSREDALKKQVSEATRTAKEAIRKYKDYQRKKIRD